jgi:hypothetical protein
MNLQSSPVRVKELEFGALVCSVQRKSAEEYSESVEVGYLT